jgi:hypothetical protein
MPNNAKVRRDRKAAAKLMHQNAPTDYAPKRYPKVVGLPPGESKRRREQARATRSAAKKRAAQAKLAGAQAQAEEGN